MNNQLMDKSVIIIVMLFIRFHLAYQWLWKLVPYRTQPDQLSLYRQVITMIQCSVFPYMTVSYQFQTVVEVHILDTESDLSFKRKSHVIARSTLCIYSATE